MSRLPMIMTTMMIGTKDDNCYCDVHEIQDGGEKNEDYDGDGNPDDRRDCHQRRHL